MALDLPLPECPSDGRKHSGGVMTSERWEIDSSHSSLHFSVRHLVIAKVRGSFARWSGTIQVPDGDFSKATVAVTIDAASIDTGVADRDGHLKSPDFFDVAQYPELRFVGKRVQPRSEEEIDVVGELTLKGITREVVLRVEQHGQAKDPWGNVRAASAALPQSIELGVGAEELGLDGAYLRVHHFARQLGSPFPLLAAVGARTKKIEIGTAVIDMRYENPMYMAEDAGAADIIAGGRLQLGISRGSPEQVIDGWRYFGHAPPDGETAADMARRHAEVFLERLKGDGFAEPNPRPMLPKPPGPLRHPPYSEGLRRRIWWGSRSHATSRWAGKHGLKLPN